MGLSAVPTKRRRLAVVAFLAATGMAGRAQTTTPDLAKRDALPIENVSVMVDTGTPAQCSASGIILGFDENQAYVAITADAPAAGAAKPTYFVTAQAPGARRVPAQVAHQVTDMRLAVLGVREPSFLSLVRQLKFDVLGDAAGIMVRDPVYTVGCAAGRLQASEPTQVIQAGGPVIAFQGPDLRAPVAGGPLVQMVGDHSMVVGLIQVVRARAQASAITAVLDRVRTLGVPVALTPAGTRAGCSYSLKFSRKPTPMSGVDTLLFYSTRDRIEATVDTTPDCTWTAHADGGGWLAVSGSRVSAARVATMTGPGTVNLSTVKSNTCDGRFRDGVVYLAGRVVRTGQDGSNVGTGCGP